MNRTLKGILYIILVAGLFILLGFANRMHESVRCKSFQVSIKDDHEYRLVKEQEVREIVSSLYDSIVNRPLRQINTHLIEEELRQNPFIGQVDVFSGINGVLNIQIEQRIPLLRIIDKKNNAYYIDREGNLFRSAVNKAARVLVVNGDIPAVSIPKKTEIISVDSLDHGKIEEIFRLAELIERDAFLNAQIEQLYLDGRNYELIPKVGKHVIEFGACERAAEKLENLKAFYTRGLRNKDWNQYKKINLKFKNQIVCTKI